MKHVGFTGTRQGMTGIQKERVRDRLKRAAAAGGATLHHGDCVGADAEAHEIAVGLGLDIAIHPPDDPKARAFCTGDFECTTLPYLERNRAIVAASDLVLACPGGAEKDQPRSGTWATIRHARKVGKVVIVMLPGGA